MNQIVWAWGYAVLLLLLVWWCGSRCRTQPPWIQLLVAVWMFLFSGIGVLVLLGSSERVLLVVSCLNQLATLIFLLRLGIGETPAPLPSNRQLLGYTLGSVAIGGSSLIISGLWLRWYESMGGTVEVQGLVELLQFGGALDLWLTMVLVVGLAPVAEELLFRGMLLPRLVHRFGEWGGIALTGILFGLMHFETWSAVPPLMIFGMLLSWWRRYTGWIVFPVLAHFCNNYFVVLTL